MRTASIPPTTGNPQPAIPHPETLPPGYTAPPPPPPPPPPPNTHQTPTMPPAAPPNPQQQQQPPSTAAATAAAAEPGLVTCWYCLEQRPRGSHCCGHPLNCWCAACNISGELGKPCEYCGAVLEVFVYDV